MLSIFTVLLRRRSRQRLSSSLRRFAARRVRFLCPDFNQPDFSTLTVSRMLTAREANCVSPARRSGSDWLEPWRLRGGGVGRPPGEPGASSDFPPDSARARRLSSNGNAGRNWAGAESSDGAKRAASRCFTYAENKPQRLNFEFYEDTQQYRPATRQLNQPVMIFQDMHDESVSPASSNVCAGSGQTRRFTCSTTVTS